MPHSNFSTSIIDLELDIYGEPAQNMPWFAVREERAPIQWGLVDIHLRVCVKSPLNIMKVHKYCFLEELRKFLRMKGQLLSQIILKEASQTLPRQPGPVFPAGHSHDVALPARKKGRQN